MSRKDILLQDWEYATDTIAKFFADKYFSPQGREDDYWVADDIGGTYYVADYFFSAQDMVDYLKYKYTKNQMFQHYDESLDLACKDMPIINIRNWKKFCTGTN